MILLEGLRKQYGDVHALAGFDLEARNGTITTLLGANGSGKTTALRALSGLLRPDNGRVRIDDHELPGSLRAARSSLGFLPDRFGLYPRLTAAEHLRFFGRLKGLSGAALAREVDAVVELLSMNDLANRRTAGFSHGQRVKVALGQTLIGAPGNLVLDEPTRGLDVFSVRLLRRVLRRLRDEGRCILLSTHVMAEVEDLSDHIVVIAGGRTVASGDSAHILSTAGCAGLEDSFVALAGGGER